MKLFFYSAFIVSLLSCNSNNNKQIIATLKNNCQFIIRQNNKLVDYATKETEVAGNRKIDIDILQQIVEIRKKRDVAFASDHDLQFRFDTTNISIYKNYLLSSFANIPNNNFVEYKQRLFTYQQPYKDSLTLFSYILELSHLENFIIDNYSKKIFSERWFGIHNFIFADSIAKVDKPYSLIVIPEIGTAKIYQVSYSSLFFYLDDKKYVIDYELKTINNLAMITFIPRHKGKLRITGENIINPNSFKQKEKFEYELEITD